VTISPTVLFNAATAGIAALLISGCTPAPQEQDIRQAAELAASATAANQMRPLMPNEPVVATVFVNASGASTQTVTPNLKSVKECEQAGQIALQTHPWAFTARVQCNGTNDLEKALARFTCQKTTAINGMSFTQCTPTPNF